MYPYKLNKYYDDENTRIEQWIVLIFVWKLFKTVELKEKINVIEHNRLLEEK